MREALNRHINQILQNHGDDSSFPLTITVWLADRHTQIALPGTIQAKADYFGIVKTGLIIEPFQQF